MKKKSAIAITALLTALAVGVAVLAVLNGKNAAAKKQLQDDASFLIIAGEEEYKITMEEFQELDLRDIQANYKKSGKAPETRTYTGVSFAAVLRMKRINLAGVSTAAFAAADGYASILSLEDALNEDNCFIVIAENGEPLGKKEDGGSGPFRMILAVDQFSQRWCSFLTDVTLK